MKRRSEQQNFDHDNIQDYIISYAVTGKDYSVNTLPDTDATVGTLVITATLVDEVDFVETGIITETGYVLASESGYPLIIE